MKVLQDKLIMDWKKLFFIFKQQQIKLSIEIDFLEHLFMVAEIERI